MPLGTVFWITGLSGAGKTTIGQLLYEHLVATKPNVVFLDGDTLRIVFGNDLGHTREDRLKSAMRNARLCKMLSDQSIDVVCATISMFHECQNWNRENIRNYKEIFIDAPLAVLIERDSKGLYSDALSGAEQSIVGLHIAEERPLNADLILENDGSKSVAELTQIIIGELVAK